MALASGLAARPIILGMVGDSAAGKSTLSRGIARLLGPERVAVLCTDDYHRYNRQQRKDLQITPLDPACNYLDIMAQHLQLLRAGEAILKPHYDHSLGDFGPPQYIVPRPFLIVEGLLGFYRQEMRNAYSVHVYLDPPELLRRRWKISRDTTRRGYAETDVLRELDQREHESATFIRPQRQYADVIISFYPDEDSPSEAREDAHLNVRLTLHGTLRHPDLNRVISQDDSGCVRSILGREGGRAVEYIEIDGSIPDAPARALERCILQELDAGGAASPEYLGEYDYHRGNELGEELVHEPGHSHPLALTQLLLVYHVLRAKQQDEAEA